MPTGVYRLADGTLERFSCAPGPAGWRYVSDQVDLTVDARWSVVRLVVSRAGWHLRGGVVGPDVRWRRGVDERSVRALGFTGLSPAYDVAVARLLALGVGQAQRVRLVEVTEPVAATRTVDVQWARVADERGTERFEVDDLATGERRVVHLLGDVVVDRLHDLDTPPSGLPQSGMQP